MRKFDAAAANLLGTSVNTNPHSLSRTSSQYVVFKSAQEKFTPATKKSPDPTTGKGSEIGGSSFQVVVPGSTSHRAGPRHLSKLRAPV
jgi:hypothetical protein